MKNFNCPHCWVALNPSEWLLYPESHLEGPCENCGKDVNVYFEFLIQKGFNKRLASPPAPDGEGGAK